MLREHAKWLQLALSKESNSNQPYQAAPIRCSIMAMAKYEGPASGRPGMRQHREALSLWPGSLLSCLYPPTQHLRWRVSLSPKTSYSILAKFLKIPQSGTGFLSQKGCFLLGGSGYLKSPDLFALAAQKDTAMFNLCSRQLPGERWLGLFVV